MGVEIRPEEEICSAPSATNFLIASRTGITETLNFLAKDLKVKTWPGFKQPPRISDLRLLYITSFVGNVTSLELISLFILLCDHKKFQMSNEYIILKYKFSDFMSIFL